MSGPAAWSPDGTRRGQGSGAIEDHASNGRGQGPGIFLAGAGLPAAWDGQRQWRILQTDFGLGLAFLASWHAWQRDPQRPALLHFASIAAVPVAAEDLLHGAQAHPELLPLAAGLSAQWWGLVPGVHRLAFEGGRVLLTLAVGDARAALQEQDFAADAVLLDAPAPGNDPAEWELPMLKAVTRLCRRGTALVTRAASSRLQRDLQQCGFVLEQPPGAPADSRGPLRGRFDPAWTTRSDAAPPALAPGRALVIGAGLAGSAAAASLARRGWQVQVVDRADTPASGASALPAGLLAPHTSPDDNLLSRLSRAGVRVTLQQAFMLLEAGIDWEHSGVLEHRATDARPAADLGPDGAPWHDARPVGLWHAAGAWIKPAALVRAWLAQPGIEFRGRTQVGRLERGDAGWRALDARGIPLAEADLVVVAAALDSGDLLPAALALNPVRGQVSWQLRADGLALPPSPVNGNGHFLPAVPLSTGLAWLTGSTYGRGETAQEARPQDHLANLDRLRELIPDVAAALEPGFTMGAVQAWTGVRCTSSDRRPLVGEVAPGLCVSTAMGSRGLTFAHLAAELLAARLHGEPLPLPARLAAAIDVARQLADPR